MSEILEIGANDADRFRNRMNGLGVVNDPHSRFDELRSSGDVHSGTVASLFGLPDLRHTPDGLNPRFTVIGNEAAETVFRRNETFSSNAVYERTQRNWGPNILAMDEPEHRRYRVLAQPAFAARAMDSWRNQWLSPILDDLIDSFQNEVHVDLYLRYCAKFPANTIASGFGVKAADVPEFHQRVLQMGGNVESQEQIDAASSWVADYIKTIIVERMQNPGDDLISLLVSSQVTDEDGSVHRLDENEILGFAGLMITAGSGSTYRTMGIVLLALLDRPELLAQVRRDRTLIPRVIEETLRWEPPAAYFARGCVENTELAGVAIPAGSLVEVSISAANHDPRKWDDPHRFDPFRPLRPHLSFASGPHFCIGNQLARMELATALNRLLDRVPHIELDPQKPRPFVTGLFFRMPTALPVVLRDGVLPR